MKSRYTILLFLLSLFLPEQAISQNTEGTKHVITPDLWTLTNSGYIEVVNDSTTINTISQAGIQVVISADADLEGDMSVVVNEEAVSVGMEGAVCVACLKIELSPDLENSFIQGKVTVKFEEEQLINYDTETMVLARLNETTGYWEVFQDVDIDMETRFTIYGPTVTKFGTFGVFAEEQAAAALVNFNSAGTHIFDAGYSNHALNINLSKESMVSIDIHDMRGRLLSRVVQQNLSAGMNSIPISLTGSGVYVARINADGNIQQVEINLVR